MGQDISAKTGRVLNIILLSFILILVRVWYLAVIQHDAQLEQSHKPQRRVVIEPAPRASIQDRFNIPLALNKIQYNIAIRYADIRQIPSVSWKKSEKGKMIRVQARLEHIESLAQRLGEELGLDPVNIQDIIHGKAALFPHTPFVIKENITEEQYYKLRMLEKDWIGLQAQMVAKRFYPQEKTACDIVGYLGSISLEHYQQIADEMNTLQAYIKAREKNEKPFLPPGFYDPIQVRDRLAELQEKSYTIHDFVGKAGLEAFYEEELRGIYGKKIYEVGTGGSFLRELPGSRKPVSGRSLTLSISAELQAFAEALLSANEGPKNPDVPTFVIDEEWMKGGALIALDPKTGEVIALASYPRFNPNDFIPSKNQAERHMKDLAVTKWLENESYIGQIWDGTRPLEREYFSFVKGKYEEEKITLSWDLFLNTVLSPKSCARKVMNHVTDIKTALDIQKQGLSHPLLEEIPSEADRLLILDLSALGAKQELFDEKISPLFATQTLSSHHLFRQAALRLQAYIKTPLQELHHDHDFTKWRQTHFKGFLKRKRGEEKEGKKYPKAYTDYLDAAQRKLFQAFWHTYRQAFLYTAITGKSLVDSEQYPSLQPYLALLKDLHRSFASDEDLKNLEQLLLSLPPQSGLAYLQTMRSFEELTAPLKGSYKRIRKNKEPSNNQIERLAGPKEEQLEKHLAAAFYPVTGYGYGRSQAYRQENAPGSVFKLATAYQALIERLKTHPKGDLNPLTLIDDLKGGKSSTSLSQVLGYTEQGDPILRRYKGGVLPRSSYSGMGKLDILGALEQSSNLYFSILASEHLEDPTNLSKAAYDLGFGQKTGIDLPGEVSGKIPSDLAHNRSGLYSFAIGHHTFAASPLQTAVMMGAIATRGTVVKPKVVKMLSGKDTIKTSDPFSLSQFPLQDELSLVGIHFPLFTAAIPNLQEASIHYTPVEIERTIPFPPEVFKILAQGMSRSVKGPRGSSRPSIMRSSYLNPNAARDYYELQNELLPKTGTAQVLYKQSIDTETPAYIRWHICFATIAYSKNQALSPHPFEDPELVVVAFSKYGTAGRNIAPMAAQVVKKWREIQKKHALENLPKGERVLP
jgi:cell division protein FtsI/penicillin-binding protein 2